MPQIRVLLGYQQGQVFSLRESAVVIGRDPRSGIVLHPDSAASRRHAEVFPANGNWRVRDLGSVNGTILNGRHVNDEVLRDNDEVLIGDNVFVFEEEDEDAARIAEAASRVNAIETRGFPNRPEAQMLVHSMAQKTRRIEAEVRNVCGASAELTRMLLIAVISQSHVLIGGANPRPEIADALARLLGLGFARVECSPRSALSAFTKACAGSQLLLVEKVDHAPLMVQAVLLDAMQDCRMRYDGQTCPIDLPFVVVATATPVAASNVPGLSEEHVDRFMFSVDAGAIASAGTGDVTTLDRVLKSTQVLELQRAVREMPAADHIVKYAVTLARATLPADRHAPEFVKKHVTAGAGPRAAEGLVIAAKAHAVAEGRLHITQDDVRAVAVAVLRHRIFTSFSAVAVGIDGDAVARRIVEELSELDTQSE